MHKIHILCTRPADKELIASAALKGIQIDILSFIETEPIENIEVQQEIENALILTTTVVFTSMNAVEAVASFVDVQPEWKIYSIGNTTKKLVEQYFGESAVAGTADSAGELALLIAEEGEDSVIFFCGDNRRDELPELLRENDIEVNEIIVYETISISHRITTPYHGILFFSPSAVESFFSVNKPDSKTVFFAIGSTTANAIQKYTTNRIICSSIPGKIELVQEMISFFSGE